MDTNRASGAGGESGAGLTTSSYREVTRKGLFPNGNEGGERSQGEVPGSGTLYAAVLNERPNASNTRNRGPERPGSMSAKPIPAVTMGSRATGRVGG